MRIVCSFGVGVYEQIHLKPIDKRKQKQPDHIHEVPIPAHRFKGEMVFWGEMSPETTQQHDSQHDRSHSHVRAVEAGQHKEGRAVDSGSQAQAQLVVGMYVLNGLKGQEGRAQRGTVMASQICNGNLWFFFNAQWANVTVTLLLTRMTVLMKG